MEMIGEQMIIWKRKGGVIKSCTQLHGNEDGENLLNSGSNIERDRKSEKC